MNPPFGFNGDSDESPVDWLFEEKPEFSSTNQKWQNFRLLYQQEQSANNPEDSVKSRSHGIVVFALLFAWLIVSAAQSLLIFVVLLIASTQDWMTVPPFWVVFSIVLTVHLVRIVDKLLWR